LPGLCQGFGTGERGGFLPVFFWFASGLVRDMFGK
jgi:hypothetical protein